MALAYGMTAEQYFFQDTDLFYNYKNAFQMKMDLQEQTLWLQGVYFKMALSSTPIWAYGAVNSKDMKLNDYPKEPLSSKKKEEILTEEQLKNERFKAYMYFEQVHKSNLKKRT